MLLGLLLFYYGFPRHWWVILGQCRLASVGAPGSANPSRPGALQGRVGQGTAVQLMVQVVVVVVVRENEEKENTC